MTSKNQKRLDRAAARRKAEADRATIDAQAEIQIEQEIEAEMPTPTEADTPEQEAAFARIDKANAMIRKLRDWGFNYTIQSDLTADRAACECGCGQFPAGKKSRFCPGHDAKLKASMQGPRELPECLCGCGEQTKGGKYRPGHDAKHHAALKVAAAEAAEFIGPLPESERIAS